MYHVGNYFITQITKEEYEEILQECGKEVELDHGFIVYMHNASKETISKYASRVRMDSLHKNKNAKEIQSKIWSLQSDLIAIQELEELSHIKPEEV